MKSNLSSVLLSAGLASLLAGCMSPPQPRLDQSAPAQWRQSGQATASARPVTLQELQTWWHRFNDPVLDALVDEALAQNLDLSQALGKLKEQRILLGISTAAYKPELTGGVRTLQDIAALDSYFHASIDVSWDLGLFGAYESSELAGKASLLDAQAQLRAASVNVIASVVQRYLDIRVAQGQRALMQQRVQLEERNVQLMRVRVQQRIGSSDAVRQAELELARVRAQVSPIQENQVRAAHALAALLGRTEPDASWLAERADARLPAADALDLQVLPAEMLRTRPAVLAAEAGVQRAAAAAGLSHSALYPRFALTGSLLYSYNITQNLRTRSDKMPLLGPVIDVPLFDWGRRRSQADADDVAMDNAVKAYRQSVLEGIADVEGALAGLNAQRERIQSLEGVDQLVASREQVQRRRQQLGLASELSTLEQRRTLLQNQSEQGVAQGAHALAYVALYKALGGAPLPAEPEDKGAEAGQ